MPKTISKPTHKKKKRKKNIKKIIITIWTHKKIINENRIQIINKSLKKNILKPLHPRDLGTLKNGESPTFDVHVKVGSAQ